jgi:CubicO group peptidase (beta-lactamase class C family)
VIGGRRSLAGVVLAWSLAAAAACSGGSSAAPSLEDRVAAVVDEQLSLDPDFDAVRAIEVTVDGRTVFDDYPRSSADEHHPTMSVTKSVMGTLIGIAIDEGLIEDVGEPLGALLPDHADRMSRSLRTTPLREVLTMTSGIAGSSSDDDTAFMGAADPVAAALASAARPPVREFAYSNGGAHVLGAVLVEATGRSVLDYARAELFDPLGIDTEPALEPPFAPRSLRPYLRAGFAWPVDARGLHLGWAGLKLRPGDLTRIGRLYLDGGRWRGEQVVSEEWVDAATSAQVPTDGGALESYGYQWWVGTVRGHPAFLAWGYGGQAIEVVPDLDLVMVAATELPELAGPGVAVGPMLFILEQIVREVDR